MRKISLMLVSSFLFSLGFAQNLETLKKESAQNIIKSATGVAVEKLKAKEKEKVIQEAVKVLKQTREILNFLAQNKIDKAEALLDKVYKKLTKISVSLFKKFQELGKEEVIILKNNNKNIKKLREFIIEKIKNY